MYLTKKHFNRNYNNAVKMRTRLILQLIKSVKL